jgi:hypothetical protein
MKLTTGKGKLVYFFVMALIMFLLLSSCTAATITLPEEPKEEPKEPIKPEMPDEPEIPKDEEPIKTREEIEEDRKVLYGDYYVPLPEIPRVAQPFVARGIYISGGAVASTTWFNNLISFVERTELNSVVIDVKDDWGLMTYRSSITAVEIANANRHVRVRDMKALINILYEKEIYPIARVVVFKDPNFSSKRPDLSIQKKDGSDVWRDHKGVSWVNPFNKEVWDYVLAISKEAALMGFKEIQFDYVRFPENAQRVDREAIYPGQDGRPKDDAIKEFLKYANQELKDYGVVISADVFGVIATSWGDSDGIGQSWEKVAPNLGVICPMVYPSHYGPGYFGLQYPDANPYEVIRRSMIDSTLRNAAIENPPAIRPWIQDFTAPWVPGYIRYGVEEVRAQIKAARELGINQYLLWNAGVRYTERAIYSPEEGQRLSDEIALRKAEKDQDILGRTKEWSVREAFRLWQRRDFRNLLPLIAMNFRYDLDGFRGVMGNYILESYSIKEIYEEGGEYFVSVDYSLKRPYGSHKGKGNWRIYIENDIWKVELPFLQPIDIDTDLIL